MRIIALLTSLAATVSLAMAGGSGYVDPRDYGGSMLTSWPNTTGDAEPLNIILSANSDARVLADSQWKGGFQKYMLMAIEFLGLHAGTKQRANVDGSTMDQLRVLRYDYGHPVLGTGAESLFGGNHLRYWRQSTTGAYFLAVSVEKDLKNKHDIVPDGYNLGRDRLVGDLVGNQQIDTSSVKAGDTFEGNSKFALWEYHTKAEYVAGLLEATSEGINHAATVGTPDRPAVDGLVAVLTVTVVKKGLV